MKTLAEQLTQYAAYHRDRRNIATHFVGIPMIVLGVAALLARPMLVVGGLPLAPIVPVTIGALAFYFVLDLRYGLVMTALFGLSTWVGLRIGMEPTGMWLALALGLFAVGWVIQFAGHAFEGRKPAFVDDMVGLLVGPLFIVAEAGFALGLRAELRHDIEAQVGPTVIRDAAARAALRRA